MGTHDGRRPLPPDSSKLCDGPCSFHTMAHSDVLVAACSGFPYVAAVVAPDEQVVGLTPLGSCEPKTGQQFHIGGEPEFEVRRRGLGRAFTESGEIFERWVQQRVAAAVGSQEGQET